MDSNQQLLGQERPQRGRWMWKKVLMLLLLIAAVVVSSIGLYNILLNKDLVRENQGLINTVLQNQNTPIPTPTPTPSTSTPYKFAVSSVPPRKYQLSRGTCWDFGTVGALEHSYRVQGIAKGYLQPNQYVQFSEQAYGNRILNLCAQNQNLCLLPGDNVAFGSTEGGEATLLETFAGPLANLILPHSVCPYLTTDNSSCPGIDQALAHNPLTFTLTASTTLFDIPAIKQALFLTGRAMPLSVAVHTTSYYLSCNDAFVSNTTACTKQCTPCPIDRNFGSPCCYKFNTEMYNMNGEFYKHHQLQLEAGHVMLLVGYNDEFQTENGMKGGLIMRNTWIDGVYSFDEFHGDVKQRGSHSLAYFMGQISAPDERYLCPNSHNPRNWYACPTSNNDNATAASFDCLNPNNAKTAYALYYPYQLICRPGQTECDPDLRFQYYAINSTWYNDELTIMCFLKYDTVSGAASFWCGSPRPWDQYSKLFAPNAADDKRLANQDDFCGYYFFPYDLIRESAALFQGFWVNNYQIQWSDASYAVNAAANPNLDYSFIRSSTGTQQPLPNFDNAYPNDQPVKKSARMVLRKPKF